MGKLIDFFIGHPVEQSFASKNVTTHQVPTRSSEEIEQAVRDDLDGSTATAVSAVYACARVIADLRVTGNAIITGTINPEALALDRFVKRINGTGAGSPAAGQTLLLYAQDIGVTTANGSYLIVLTGQMTTTVGRQTSTLGGLPYYINHNADGGLRIVINKNGSTIYQTDIHASEYITANDVGPKVYSLNRNIEIDSPGGGDASGGNATILIYAVRGGADSGAVNQGDYYTRDVSATYSGFNIAAKTKWTFT